MKIYSHHLGKGITKSLQKIPCYWEVWASNYTDHTLMFWNVSTNSEKNWKKYIFFKRKLLYVLKRYIYHVIYGWKGIIQGIKTVIKTFYSLKPVNNYIPLKESIELTNFSRSFSMFISFFRQKFWRESVVIGIGWSNDFS